MTIWNQYYKGLKIRADCRVHDKIIELMKELNLNRGELLDIACGEGALAQRIIDEFPKLNVDVNDYDADQIKCAGHQMSSDVNLNDVGFNLSKQYDVIIAVEILEHLENPWNFIRSIKALLKPNGVILLSTPNIDSVFDRIFYLRYGYHYYFGARGIVNSGNHITMVPLWLMEHICVIHNMKIFYKTYVDTSVHMGRRLFLLKILLTPFLFLAKNKNDASINIMAINNLMTEALSD